MSVIGTSDSTNILFNLQFKRAYVIGGAKCGTFPAGAVQSGLEVLPSQYPPVYRDDSVKADFFGTTVYDPYRWLENTDSNETIACARPIPMPISPTLLQQ